MGPKSAALKDAHRLLGNCVLFSGLDAEERAAIAAQARIRSFEAGETVFNLGSPGDHMMAVLSGTIRISVPSPDGKELVLTIIQPGEVFGELAALDGKERSADAIAENACTLAMLYRSDVLRSSNETHRLGSSSSKSCVSDYDVPTKPLPKSRCCSFQLDWPR